MNMKSIFLVWKDKNCNGENPEWIYMKANEFFEFKKLPENADRRFVQVGDKKSSLEDTVIFIEANEELYKKSNAEQSRTDCQMSATADRQIFGQALYQS